MLDLILLLGATAVAPETNSVSAASRTFRECVRREAVVLAGAGETAQATVDAAFLACSNEEAEFALAIMDRQQGNSPLTQDKQSRLRELQVKITIDSLRAELVPGIMRQRAAAKR